MALFEDLKETNPSLRSDLKKVMNIKVSVIHFQQKKIEFESRFKSRQMKLIAIIIILFEQNIATQSDSKT